MIPNLRGYIAVARRRLPVQRQVRLFHEAFDLVIRDTPQDISLFEARFRLRLLAEEVGEVVGAMCGMEHDAAAALGEALAGIFLAIPMAPAADVAQIAREHSDLLCVLYGNALHYGYDQDAAAGEVMAACMRRLGADGKPVKREDGKVIKPPGWEPPDVAAAIGVERSVT